MRTPLGSADPCPCGGSTFGGCCAELLRNQRQAATPEELMRSRFTANALGDADHLFRTWHPRTRPEDPSPTQELTWTRLEILATEGDTVHFRAHHTGPYGDGVLEELSRFERRAGRWVYVDGDVRDA